MDYPFFFSFAAFSRLLWNKIVRKYPKLIEKRKHLTETKTHFRCISFSEHSILRNLGKVIRSTWSSSFWVLRQDKPQAKYHSNENHTSFTPISSFFLFLFFVLWLSFFSLQESILVKSKETVVLREVLRHNLAKKKTKSETYLLSWVIFIQENNQNESVTQKQRK